MALLHSGARGLTPALRDHQTIPEVERGAIEQPAVSKAPLARFAVAPQPLDYDPDLLLGQNHRKADVREHPLFGNSLNAFNAASSQKTLRIKLIIAVMGMALVIAYTIPVYWYCAAKSASPGRVVDGTVESPSPPSPEPGDIVGDNRK